MRFFQVLARFVRQSVSQVIESTSSYMTRIGFSDSLFLLTLLLFPLLKFVSFLLQSIGDLHVGFLPFVMIGMILLLLITGIQLRGYLTALFYCLLNTTLAQVILYYCLCCEQVINASIGFGMLIGGWLGFVYVHGILYQHLVLLPNAIFLVFFVYYRLRRRLWNDDVIRFVSTPKGVLWSDALHGLDTAFRTRMGINNKTGVTAPNRIVNRLSNESNIAFPFLIRKRTMGTVSQETGKSIADWMAQNPGQVTAIATAVGTSVAGLCFEGWRGDSRHREQMEAAERARIEQMETAERARMEQMEAKITRSIEQAKQRYCKDIQELERERVGLDSVWNRFSLDRPQMIQLNERQIQQIQANFEAYQQQQEELIRSAKIQRLPNQHPGDDSQRTPLNSESVHDGRREEQAQNTLELVGTQTLASSPGSLATTDYSSFLSAFV